MKCLCDIFYKDFRDNINLEIVSKETKIPIEEVLKISMNLESQGLIKYTPLKKNYSVIQEETRTIMKEKTTPSAIVSLTDAGKCYFETKRDRMFEFFRKSVIVPIVISIATTLITNLVTGWLPEILKWVQSHLNF